MSLQTKDNNALILTDIETTERICTALMKTKHYAKMGMEGIYAIIQKSLSLGIKPIEALNGGMYFVKGKVELSSILMAKLIRQQKHSITMDKNSGPTICILHGKRADNGDTWRASFSIEDAKRAGIYKDAWLTYPDVMCYNRALSKIARQLFPDVIGNCYVEGEIAEVEIFDENRIPKVEEAVSNELASLLVQCDEEFQKTVLAFLEQRFGAPDFSLLPEEMYQTIKDKIEAHLKQRIETKEKDSIVDIAKQALNAEVK